MAEITSGIITSFSNTPQAQSDLYTVATLSALTSGGLTEDGGYVILNVMANDLGGNAKVLWSLDNADSASTGTKIYAPSDLLVQDTGGAGDLTPDTSLWGSKIWITSEGKVAYQMTEASKAHFQSLAAGEVGLDTFTYAIRMSNGALSWSTVTVQILGTNDGPVIVTGDAAYDVSETLTETQAA
jgi:VCBS repeat-containing protein